MRVRTVIGSVLASALVVAAGVAAVVPASARDSTTLLDGVKSRGDVAVGGGKVFVSADDRIVVADTEGTVTSMVTGVSGARGLAMTPDGTRLYVALSGSGEVAEIDTAGLAVTRRIGLGAYPSPSHLSLAGNELWVGYGTSSTFTGGVLGLDLSVGAPEPVQVASGMYGAPLVAAVGDTLVAGEAGLSPGSMRVYDLSTTPATLRGVISGHTYGLSNLCDFALTPDGSTVISAFGAPYHYDAWSTTTLNKVGTYGAESSFPGYPVAVAVSPDGAYIAGGRHAGPRIQMHDAVTTMKTYSADNPAGDLVSGSLAFSGSDVFGVLEDWSRGRFYLWRAEGVTLPGSTLTLTPPSGATALEPFTMTGRLTLADGSDPGAQPLEVTRQLPDGTTATLDGVTTGADGTFTITDTPPVGGAISYGVIWDGSPTFRWSKTSASVDVARHATSLSVSGPTTGTARKRLVFTGVLSTAGQVRPPAGSITVQRALTNRSGYTLTALPAAPLATDGSFTFADTPPVGGQYVYHVQWPGDDTFLPAYTSHEVWVRGTGG